MTYLSPADVARKLSISKTSAVRLMHKMNAQRISPRKGMFGRFIVSHWDERGIAEAAE